MRRRGFPGLLIAAVVLLFVLPSAASFYTSWLWFKELGYERVFLRELNAKSVLFAATFFSVFLFLYFNLVYARRRTFDRPSIVLGTGASGRPVALEGRQIAGFAMPVALVVALLAGLMATGDWLTWLSFFHAAPFGQRDPLFGRDLSFYVFRLPIYETLRQQALLVSVITLVGCGIYYVFSGSFVIEARPGVSSWPRIRLIPAARRHLSLLTALILGLMAWGAWLEIPRVLLTPTTSVVAFGASFADVYAHIPFLRVTIAVLVLGAALSIWHGFGRRGWPLPLAIALYLVVSVSGGLYGSFVQRFLVTPNELDKERPYIIHNIAATRAAYALDRVDERELSGDAELSATDIIANAGTIENVRLWDHEPLKQTFAQIQEIRTYYDFVNIDNDRYTIDGKYRQVMLSARELNTESLQTRSWQNEHLSYTHGFGLTLGPVNQVTTEGLPVLFVRDIPPVSTVNLRVDQPSIYYGELSNDYVIVKTKLAEFHYPKGDDNESTFYDGTGGVPLNSIWRRIMFALRFVSTDVLVTNQLTPQSRIMFHRKISDRVKLLAPFLTFDSDPYPVLSNGRLFWIQDAYTTSANYPYATMISPRPGLDLNYIRNSIKITIDAYHGTTTFYLADADDPIAKTIASIFPGFVRPLADMPADLRQHVRYPEDIFQMQALMYSSYHMTNTTVFYNKEDQWSVPVLEDSQNSVAMKPYYTVMRLPGVSHTEFIQMLPFTPRAKDNLSAWMVARSDAENYGHMLVFQFPKNSIVYGPRQIVGRINQDQLISPQITLWGQQGSKVIWGTLLVIPLNESLIYVRPLYLRSSDGRIPELKRVVVAYQNRIVMAETLRQALMQIFGPTVGSALPADRLESSATSVIQTAPEPGDVGAGLVETPHAVPATVTPDNATMAELASQAKQHYDRMSKAASENDWALFGEEKKKLGDVLARMEKLRSK